MKLNSHYAKMTAEWFRKNVEKPSPQAMDIRDTDIYLIHGDRDTGLKIFRAVIYGELYNIKFNPTLEWGKDRMVVTKMSIIFEENVEVQ